jgi:hypothetical protein
MVVSDGSLSIDCLNCSEKRAHVCVSPNNGSSLIGANLIAADGVIGATIASASQESVIVTFAVDVAKCLYI